MANVKIVSHGDTGSTDEIATNSLSIANGDLVTLADGFVDKAVEDSTVIVGIANGTKVYASNNKTVAKEKLNYKRLIPRETMVELPLSDNLLNQTDVGKFYALNASQQVDLAT